MLAHDHFKTSVDAQPSTHLWRRAIARLLSNWSLVVAVLVGAASACGLLIRHPLSTTPLVRFDQRLALVS